MSHKFYRPSLPVNADYCSRKRFVSYLDVLNQLEIVDDRWSREDIERITNTTPPSELAAFFEIEDWVESQQTYAGLRSMSLFRLRDTPIEAYVKGVFRQVQCVLPQCPDMLFRFYVSNEIWDSISELIDTPGTEFVKMQHDSRYSRIGTFWRFMALNDDRFEVVITGDVDDEDDFCLSVDTLKAMTQDVKLFGSVLFLREEMEYFLTDRASLDMFLESDLHGDAIFIESISSLNRFGGKEIARGNCQLPDMVKLICEYLSSAPIQKLYNPSLNRWALFHEREPRLGASELGFMNEFFPVFLQKLCRRGNY